MESGGIERITKTYWDQFEPSEIRQAMRWYICQRHHRYLRDKSLLEAELEYARQHQQIDAKPCDTLVLLVGFSLEPLLQSVCVYKPQKVVLILNEQGYGEEGWNVFAHHVTEAIGYLVEQGLLPDAPQIPGKDGKTGYPVKDDPSSVFRTLLEILRDETNVVIDVTGGKKSMVSGAYLYAAYAGARISYVDFEQYDPRYRRPYGFSCKIGELTNPYETFALRDWERVRATYQRYQFRASREILRFIRPVMREVMPDSKEPIKMLDAFLDYYEKWDSGDLKGAKQLASQLPDFKQPSAVEKLGDQWPNISHFYGNLDAVKVYVADELERIRRLINYNGDYRSAFLRAGGVNEIVMIARVVSLVKNEIERISLLNALDQNTPSIYSVFNNLLKPAGTQIELGQTRNGRVKFGQQHTLLAAITLPSPMKRWWKTTNIFNGDDGWKDFLDRRNELAHKYFSVPREEAEDALKFVTANFEDFFECSLDDLDLRTTALPWPDLCELCGLDRFLPPNLR